MSTISTKNVDANRWKELVTLGFTTKGKEFTSSFQRRGYPKTLTFEVRVEGGQTDQKMVLKYSVPSDARNKIPQEAKKYVREDLGNLAIPKELSNLITPYLISEITPAWKEGCHYPLL